jgi:uncharacterized protein YijF (DUF1287 family)
MANSGILYVKDVVKYFTKTILATPISATGRTGRIGAVVLCCIIGIVDAEPPPAAQDAGASIVAAARQQVGKTLYYDPSYTRIAYPMGTSPLKLGFART